MTENQMRHRLGTVLAALALAGCSHAAPQPCSCAVQPVAPLPSISATPVYAAPIFDPSIGTALLYSAAFPPSWTVTPVYSAQFNFPSEYDK